MKLNKIFLNKSFKNLPKATVLTTESICLGLTVCLRGFTKEEPNIF